MKFKVGDKIRCIDKGGNSFIEENEIYTVLAVGKNWGEEAVRLDKRKMGARKSHLYPIRLFELLESKACNEFESLFYRGSV